MEFFNKVWKCETNEFIRSIDVSSDGSLIAVGTPFAILLVDNGRKLIFKKDEIGPINVISINEGGSKLVVGSRNKLCCYNQAGVLLWDFIDVGEFFGVSISSNIIFASSTNGYIYVFDDNGNLLRKIIVDPFKREKWCERIEISIDLSTVIAGYSDGSVQCFDFFKDCQKRWSFKVRGRIFGLDVSRDGSFTAIGSSDKNIYFIDRNGNLLWKYPTGHWVNDTKLSNDGSILVGVSQDSFIYCFNRNGKELWRYPIGAGARSLGLSGDGLELTVGTEDGLINYFKNKRFYNKNEKITIIQAGEVIMGDVFKNIQNATIINKSVIKNSFNKINKEHGDDVAKALLQIAEFIEKSGNREAGELFDTFNEEINNPHLKKSVLKSLWGGIEKALPAITTLSEAIAKIISIF